MLSAQEQIEYWRKSAREDFKTANVLFAGKRYSAALFFGHIVLEKILKALVVLKTKKEPPKIHNLIRLVELAELELNQGDKDYLLVANDFNIRGRYEDYKNAFYKICAKDYASDNLKRIKTLYEKLCQKLKQKEL